MVLNVCVCDTVHELSSELPYVAWSAVAGKSIAISHLEPAN